MMAIRVKSRGGVLPGINPVDWTFGFTKYAIIQHDMFFIDATHFIVASIRTGYTSPFYLDIYEINGTEVTKIYSSFVKSYVDYMAITEITPGHYVIFIYTSMYLQVTTVCVYVEDGAYYIWRDNFQTVYSNHWTAQLGHIINVDGTGFVLVYRANNSYTSRTNLYTASITVVYDEEYPPSYLIDEHYEPQSFTNPDIIYIYMQQAMDVCRADASHFIVGATYNSSTTYTTRYRTFTISAPYYTVSSLDSYTNADSSFISMMKKIDDTHIAITSNYLFNSPTEQRVEIYAMSENGVVSGVTSSVLLCEDSFVSGAIEITNNRLFVIHGNESTGADAKFVTYSFDGSYNLTKQYEYASDDDYCVDPMLTNLSGTNYLFVCKGQMSIQHFTLLNIST
jgi:hypothetical protein